MVFTLLLLLFRLFAISCGGYTLDTFVWVCVTMLATPRSCEALCSHSRYVRLGVWDDAGDVPLVRSALQHSNPRRFGAEAFGHIHGSKVLRRPDPKEGAESEP